MRLATIADLLTSPTEEVDELIGKTAALSSVYENYLEAATGDAHTRSPGIHASEISGCTRRIVYSILGMAREDKADAAWKRRFRIGHAVHAMFQQDFAKMARHTNLVPSANWVMSFEEEVPIAPRLQPLADEWSIHSHCDGIFTIRESLHGPVLFRVVLEIKTASPSSYEQLMKKAVPDPDHIEQAHVYMACLDTPLTWFLYYNKGNQNYTGTDAKFLIRFNPTLWDKLLKRFRLAHEHAGRAVSPDGKLLESELPAREVSVKCTFCAFSWTCQPPNKTRAAWRPLRGPNG